jgi:hypothetical protein
MTALTATPHKAFSIGRVWAIASNTMLELTRLKIFYFLLLFGVLMIGSSLLFVDLQFQDRFQALKDVSLAGISIFTWLLAVLPTAMLLPKDLEDRTLYTILAKPVPRFEYLLGKLCGVLLLLAVATALMSVIFAGVLSYQLHKDIGAATAGTPPEYLEATLRNIHDSAFNANLIPGIAIIYVKAALCASLTLLISTFSSSWIFTVNISLMVYFIGSVQALARAVWQETHTTTSVLTADFLAVVSVFFPDLQIFSLVDDVVVGTAIPAAVFIKASLLGASYCVLYLGVAYLLFAWKEL